MTVNDQTQHNHPPRCCCISINDEQFGTYRTDKCPMCIEHGELAQLAEWKPEYPGQPEPQYPCCHQTIGRPHTDYCRNLDRCTCDPTGSGPHLPGCALEGLDSP